MWYVVEVLVRYVIGHLKYSGYKKSTNLIACHVNMADVAEVLCEGYLGAATLMLVIG